MALFCVIACIAIIVDQVAKFAVVKLLKDSSVGVINNVFSFTYLENRGAAWGIFSNCNWILTILTPVLIAGVVFFVIKISNSRLEKIAGALIVGGALGNYIDRIFRGYVVDFLDFRIWPIFNLADVFIVCGCALFVLAAFKSKN